MDHNDKEEIDFEEEQFDELGNVANDRKLKKADCIPNAIKKKQDLILLSRAWFHVSTGLVVDSGAGLSTGEEMLVIFDEQLYSDTYDRKFLEFNNWLKLKVMKTRGKFCILVNSLNILDVSPMECEQIFNSFLRFHTSKGEIDISNRFIELRQLKPICAHFPLGIQNVDL